MVQPAESRQGWNLASRLRANFSNPTCWRILRESQMGPVFVVRVDNATPIISNREMSVTLGILGTPALWRSTKF
jgi:hypothetical protein